MKNNTNQGHDDKNDNYMNIFDHLVFPTNNSHDASYTQENDNYFNTNTFPSTTNQFNAPSTNEINQNIYQMQTYFAQQLAPESTSSSTMLLNHELDSMYSNNTVHYDLYSPSTTTTTHSTPVSPIIARSNSTSPLLTRQTNSVTSPVLRAKKQQQFKFRKNRTAEATTSKSASNNDSSSSSSSKKTDILQEPSLDTLIMIKNQIEQEIMRKNQQQQQEKHDKEMLLLRQQEEQSKQNTKGKARQQEPLSDNEEEEDEDDDEYDDDAPFVGDGAHSQSSKSSHGSSKPLSKEDKRRRNTAASARFRIKKKLREQALQSTAFEMTEKATRMEQRVNELEREIKWLKALLVEKSEERLKQLIKDRPLHSVAFPINTNNNGNSFSGDK